MYLTGSPVVVVSVLDEALDVLSFNVAEYYRERDPSILVAKDGQKLTRFHCARVRASVFEQYVQQGSNDLDAYMRAFRVGVGQIDDLVDNVRGDHHARLEPRGKKQLNGSELPCLDDEQMELVAPSVKQEIGSVIWALSFFGLGTKPSFHRLPSLLVALEDRLYRDAGVTRSGAPAESTAKPPDAPTQRSGESGDAGTGATAKTRKTRSRKATKTSMSKGSKAQSSKSRGRSRKAAPGKPTKRRK